MQEGLRLYPNFEKDLTNYFNLNEELTKFYFTQPYIQAIIKISNAKIYDEKFIKDVIGYFNESIKRIELLIQKSNPEWLKTFTTDIFFFFNVSHLLEFSKIFWC